MRLLRLLMLLFVSGTVLFAGCEKENGNDMPVTPSETTYDVHVHDINVPETVSIECLVIEYSSLNEPLETYRFGVSSYGSIRRHYIATSNSVKVKVAFNVRSLTSSNSAVTWVQKVFYLNKGGNIQVEVTGTSPTGNTEP